MDLKLRHYDKDGIEGVDVQGEIDMYTAPRLRELLIDLVSEGDHHLVVNLAKVGFVDSSGLGVLVRRRGEAAEGSGAIGGEDGHTPGGSRTVPARSLDSAALQRLFPAVSVRRCARSGVPAGDHVAIRSIPGATDVFTHRPRAGAGKCSTTDPRSPPCRGFWLSFTAGPAKPRTTWHSETAL